MRLLASYCTDLSSSACEVHALGYKVFGGSRWASSILHSLSDFTLAFISRRLHMNGARVVTNHLEAQGGPQWYCKSQFVGALQSILAKRTCLCGTYRPIESYQAELQKK